jgi:guanylate kinase
VIAQRLERAREECVEIDKYDYLVVNDSVVAAVGEVVSILTAEGCRVENRRYLTQGIISQNS